MAQRTTTITEISVRLRFPNRGGSRVMISTPGLGHRLVEDGDTLILGVTDAVGPLTESACHALVSEAVRVLSPDLSSAPLRRDQYEIISTGVDR